jgi:hypothetical protein
MPALQIARKHDPRVAMNDFTLVYVPQRPVVIAFNQQIVDLTRRIRRMTVAPVQRGMQQAAVEILRQRLRIAGRDVVYDIALRIAASVDGDSEIVEQQGFDFAGR